MFLLLLLNETKLIRKHSGECCHSIHRDQLTCFAKGDLVTFFKVSPIVYRLEEDNILMVLLEDLFFGGANNV